MKFGSLFAGIGGLDLGLERAGMECAWQVEIDDYCTRVLEKHWPDVRRYRNVKEVHGIDTHANGERREIIGDTNARNGEQGACREFIGVGCETNVWEQRCPSCLPPVDLIAGGFPCQPHSVAGKQLGEKDDRNLWPEFIRVIRETKPRYVLAENVPGIITTYLDTVLSDLEGEGYDSWPFTFAACGFDAPHRRERIFIVAHSRRGFGRTSRYGENQRGTGASSSSCKRGRKKDVGNNEKFRRDERELEKSRENRKPKGETGGPGGTSSHASSEGLEEWQGRRSRQSLASTVQCDWWTVEPDVGRVAHGVPSRVDRLRGLGNAVVPQVAEWIGRRIMEFEEESSTQ